MEAEYLEPEAIDTSFVPGLRERVVVVPVKDEAVLYEEDTGFLHQLDAIATIVVGLFDGYSSIAQTASELAAAFGADPGVVERDVLALAQDLGRKGLFVDVDGEFPAEETGDNGC